MQEIKTVRRNSKDRAERPINQQAGEHSPLGRTLYRQPDTPTESREGGIVACCCGCSSGSGSAPKVTLRKSDLMNTPKNGA